MSTRLAVAIVAANASDALAQARSLPPAVTLVEYRLDMMADVDVALLAKQTPVPAIFTCRPLGQGGQFKGSETERRAILRQALATKHLVDIEMEALPALADAIHDPARTIGSHHDFGGMPGGWASLGLRIQALGAGIIKLVGMAATEDDVLSPLAWLMQLSRPGVAIAMGPAGVTTRLLAPRFPSAFLSFASLGKTSAPGQIRVEEMIDQYGFHRLYDADPLLVMLTPDPVPWEEVRRYRQAIARRFSRGRPWLLPIPITVFHPGLAQALRLARVTGVMRLDEVTTSPRLIEAGLSPQSRAWDMISGRHFSARPSPDVISSFFLQGD